MKMFKNLINYIKLKDSMREALREANYNWLVGDRKKKKYWERRWSIINARMGNKYVLCHRHEGETFKDSLKAMES